MTHWGYDEVDAAVSDYLARGEQATDYEAWAQLFTDDAVYVEHSMGVFIGRDAISNWIVSCMGEYSAVTNWTEWYQIDGARVVIYAWNNFPAPTPSGRPFQFPSVSVLRYAGNGCFVRQDDFYDAAASERLAAAWSAAGGGHHLARDMSLTGIDMHQPPVPRVPSTGDEVERALHELTERDRQAARSGCWPASPSMFTEDACYRPDAGRRLDGRAEIGSWASSRDRALPLFVPNVLWHMVEGNRVVARLAHRLAGPGVHSTVGYDAMTVLHYAGDGLWSYREDVYNTHEVQRAHQEAAGHPGTGPGRHS